MPTKLGVGGGGGLGGVTNGKDPKFQKTILDDFLVMLSCSGFASYLVQVLIFSFSSKVASFRLSRYRHLHIKWYTTQTCSITIQRYVSVSKINAPFCTYNLPLLVTVRNFLFCYFLKSVQTIFIYQMLKSCSKGK